jgi:hypothetical protein
MIPLAVQIGLTLMVVGGFAACITMMFFDADDGPRSVVVGGLLIAVLGAAAIAGQFLAEVWGLV